MLGEIIQEYAEFIEEGIGMLVIFMVIAYYFFNNGMLASFIMEYLVSSC